MAKLCLCLTVFVKAGPSISCSWYDLVNSGSLKLLVPSTLPLVILFSSNLSSVSITFADALESRYKAGDVAIGYID